MKKTRKGPTKKVGPESTITVSFTTTPSQVAKFFDDPRGLPGLAMLQELLGRHLAEVSRKSATRKTRKRP